MSLLKIFLFTLIMHIFVFSIIWIGLPVPLPREAAAFVYVGAGGVTEIARQVSTQNLSGQKIDLRLPEGGVFQPWIIYRNVTRPTR